jgi:8-oxo-dGTP pyrophosphatase MutT (NUDIX family)
MHTFAPAKAVLALLFKNGELVLARKNRRGKTSYGKRLGFGGGIDSGESALDALIREVYEEASVLIKPEYAEKVAHVTFHNLKKDGSEVDCEVTVYLVHDWWGEVLAKDGMDDAHFYILKKLPYREMPIADPMWMPLVLSRRKIFGEFWYGPGQEYMYRTAEIHDLVIVK